MTSAPDRPPTHHASSTPGAPSPLTRSTHADRPGSNSTGPGEAA